MIQEKKSKESSREQEGEILDFNNPSFKFIPSGYHDWRQRGYFLICGSCDLEHAVFIGPNKVIVGKNDKGEPIIKNRKDVGLV